MANKKNTLSIGADTERVVRGLLKSAEFVLSEVDDVIDDGRNLGKAMSELRSAVKKFKKKYGE